MSIVLYILVGLLAGLVGGTFGIGGGLIMVPVFVLGFGLTQHQAQGTALAAMLPPIFILAAMRYYAAGNVKVQMAIYVAAGILIGSFIGAHYAQGVSGQHLRRLFGVLLVLSGLKMFLK